MNRPAFERSDPAGLEGRGDLPPAPISVGEALLLTAWLVVGQLLLGGVAVALGVTDFSDVTGRVVLVSIQAAVLATVIAWLGSRGTLGWVAAHRRPGRAVHAGLGVVAGGAAFVVLVLALGSLFQLLGDVEAPQQQALDDVVRGGAATLVAVTLAVAIAPVLEELVFRGALHGALKARTGVWPAAILSSAVFAAIHVEIVVSSPIFLVQLFLLGLLFVWLTERTGNVLAAVVAHMTFNATALGVAATAPAVGLLGA